MTNPLSLRSILDTNKLNGSNFMDWYRNLRIVLRAEKIAYVLEGNLPVAPKEGEAGYESYDWEAHKQHMDDNVMAVCIMLASMSPELQKQHEHMDAPSIILHLKELYDIKGRHERFEASRELFSCRMSESMSVSSHVLKMIGLIEKLGNLGFVMDAELSNDLVLTSLPSSFSQFIMNYNMHGMLVSLPELLSMLTTAEVSIKKDKTHALLIGGPNKAKGKGKEPAKGNSLKPKGKAKKKKGKKKGNNNPKDKGDAVCFHCGKAGHWKRNCPDYLKSVKDKKHGDASTSGIMT